ncbi:hypothetical protein DSO57_1034607 [Entomophthora muscae]|uniref:Uncharacterized protein n=1 Tax=Entomophthora muscae TaxID=34485 RepID=A0ACC2SCN9_9FUNG|nr:hypothetical protein DSO57_1034607 [Entomophthora muscae]
MQGGRVSPFVETLYSLLSDGQYNDIFSWDPSGRSFIIFSIKRFENDILKRFFKNSSASSFFRQLNLYEFRRISDGRKSKNTFKVEMGEFGHSEFLREQPHRLAYVCRKPVNREGRARKAIHDPYLIRTTRPASQRTPIILHAYISNPESIIVNHSDESITHSSESSPKKKKPLFYLADLPPTQSHPQSQLSCYDIPALL